MSAAGESEPAADRELIGRIVELINDRDVAALEPLLDPAVTLITGRSAWSGPGEIAIWLGRSYDHLERRWVIDELVPFGRGWLALGRVQYLWREDGRLGDESPLVLAFELSAGRLRALHLCEDEGAGRAALGS